MLKKIISKKGIVITLIVACCLMAFAIFMLLSNKISYTVGEVIMVPIMFLSIIGGEKEYMKTHMGQNLLLCK